MVAFDGDSTAEGALPADGYGLWGFVGGIECVVLGVGDVAHCVEYVFWLHGLRLLEWGGGRFFLGGGDGGEWS